MKKTVRTLRLSADTVRNLVLAPRQLADVAGGARSVNCSKDFVCDAQIIGQAKVASAVCNG